MLMLKQTLLSFYRYWTEVVMPSVDVSESNVCLCLPSLDIVMLWCVLNIQ